MSPHRENTADIESVPRMRPVQGVSFPRSGHAAVYHILRAYFQDAFVYCDPDNSKQCGCRSVPCTNPGRTFAKNHDFGLRNPFILRQRRWLGVKAVFTRFKGDRIQAHERYFIQYRTPVPAIASNFELHIRDNPHKNNISGWRAFALKDITYWNRFVDKWVLGFPASTQAPLFCAYEQLVADPHARIREILEFTSQEPIDEPRLMSVLKRFPIEPRHNLSGFEFCDESFFRELESLAAPRLAQLGLPSFAD